MKKQIMMAGLMIGCMLFTACDEENERVIPEGTQEVTIQEDKTEVTGDNLVQWTQYCVQVANLLSRDANTLRDAWTGGSSSEDGYAHTFCHPGPGKPYTSYQGCVQQILEGCADIANEVGTAKIGDPRDLWESGHYTESVYAVESWYSYHSIDDYSNNILSIRNAIYGSRDGHQAQHSVAAYLQENDPELHSRITTRIQQAYEAIQAIQAPFRSHIGHPSVLAAQTACASLEQSLSNEVKPAMMHADETALQPIIENYVALVVVPTYEDLATRTNELNKAVRLLANKPTDQAFEQAAQAWLQAREPWETSEAFLFGPVDQLGLDPNMDSWPLDADALQNILDKGNFDALIWEGDFDEGDETIAAAQNVRGFHTLEFLLFKNGQPRTIRR